MTTRLAQAVYFAVFGAALSLLIIFAPGTGQAAPYAAIVMDARTGKVLMSENADARLHPASLTKMMTLYIAFDAIKRGEITLDTMVTVSAKAAAEPPSRLGLRAGQRISLRNLIRAAAIRERCGNRHWRGDFGHRERLCRPHDADRQGARDAELDLQECKRADCRRPSVNSARHERARAAAVL